LSKSQIEEFNHFGRERVNVPVHFERPTRSFALAKIARSLSRALVLMNGKRKSGPRFVFVNPANPKPPECKVDIVTAKVQSLFTLLPRMPPGF
jgi:hypothetical protein